MKGHSQSKMSERENYTRMLERKKPDWIPVWFDCLPRVWHKYGEALEALLLKYPNVSNHRKGSVDFEYDPPRYYPGLFMDNCGCLWRNAARGNNGHIIESPLDDWSKFDTYKPPDFMTQYEYGARDWDNEQRDVERKKAEGQFVVGFGDRLFDRLYFLRGFENLMVDIAEDHPKLPLLIEMLLDYEMKLTKKWLSLGVDAVFYHTDIGTQNSLMISPEAFRKYIKPLYKEIFTYCRQRGAHVILSSDGCLLSIVPDLIECGVSQHDPQFGANPLDRIKAVYADKLAVRLDLDRQMFPFCAPADIDKHVKDSVDALWSEEGGLSLQCQFIDDITPLENIEAMLRALDTYCVN